LDDPNVKLKIQEHAETTRRVNFDSGASGERKAKKRKTQANFNRPIELDEEDPDNENNGSLNIFNSNINFVVFYF
jgi:hypothetical protein